MLGNNTQKQSGGGNCSPHLVWDFFKPQQSVYIRFVLNNRNIILISLILSIFHVLITYPGIMYTDSYVRINMAYDFKLWLHNMFEGNSGLTDAQSWLTIIPSFFMYLSIKCIGNIALYTLMQCFIFYTFTFVLVKELPGTYKKWMYCIILAVPVFSAFSVFYEAGTGCASSIIGMILLIWKWEKLISVSDQILSVFLLAFFSFITFGYRANAFTIIPAIIVIVLIKYRKILRNIILILAMISGFLFAVYMPKFLNVDSMSSYAAGFVWEIVSVIQNMDIEKQNEYAKYLDDIFGEGTTRSALTKNTFSDTRISSINSIMPDPFSQQAISAPNHSRDIIQKYICLARKEPEVFFMTKCRFIANTMGIGAPLNMWGFIYDQYGQMESYNFNDSVQRHFFVDFFSAYIEFMKIFRIPWFMFSAALFFLILWKRILKKNWKEITYYEDLLIVAIFYYGAYLLNNQSFEFRYFFPSWLLLFIMILSLIFHICEIKKIKKTWIAVLTIGFLIYTLSGGYSKFVSNGDAMIKDVVNNGQLINCTDKHQVQTGFCTIQKERI